MRKKLIKKEVPRISKKMRQWERETGERDSGKERQWERETGG